MKSLRFMLHDHQFKIFTNENIRSESFFLLLSPLTPISLPQYSAKPFFISPENEH